MSFFGGPGNTNSTPGGLFGNTAANTAAGNNTNTAAIPSGGLLGATNNTTTSATGGGLFGGATTNTSTTGGGLFGGAPATAAAIPSGGLFGNTNNAAGAPSGSLLGKTASAPSGGLFGLNSAAPNTPAPGSLFGPAPPVTGSSIPAATNTAPAPANPLFGQPKPSDQNNAPKPSLFGQPSTNNSTGASIPSIPAPSGSLFGTAPALSAATSGTSTAAPSGGLFTGGLFGKKPDAPTTASATGSTASTLPAFSLGGNKDASTTGTASTPGASTATGGLFSLGTGTSTGENKGASQQEEKKDGAAPAPAFNLFGAVKTDAGKKDSPTPGATATAQGDKSKDASAPAASTSASTSNTTTAISVPPPSMLRGKTIEEIVNHWTSELDIHVREFNQFASEVAVWDRALIENSNNLSALYAVVLAAEREQTNIDQSFEHIEQQQKDLATTLDAYEGIAGDILGGQGGGSLRALDTGPADTERDKNYMLATELHGHLDDLSSSLTQMIESVNELSLTPAGGADEKGEDAMGQITAILSSHLESLQWIDGAVHEVEAKVGDVEKRIRASEGMGAGSGGGAKTRGFGVVGR